MVSVLEDYALVLNSRWNCAGFWSVADAIVSVMRERACVLHTETYELLDFDAWIKRPVLPNYRLIQTPTMQIAAPQVVVLIAYGEKPPHKLTFSKPATYHRDNHRCLYCGVQLPAVKLTLDHVVPRSKGGPTSFENCATACEPCNRRKADLDLERCGMNLRYTPYIPQWTAKLRMPNNGPVKNTWRSFLERDKLI